MAGRNRDFGEYVEVSKGFEFRNGARSQLNATPEYFTHFTDGTTIPAGLTLQATTPVTGATYGTGLGGVAVIGSDDVAAVLASLSTGLHWQCDRLTSGQLLVFETRVKYTVLTANEFFYGFMDRAASADEIALSLTSTFTTSTPDDFALIGYSDTPTSGAAFTSGGNWHTAISGLATVNTVVATGGRAKVATGTFYTYRVTLDKNGNAAFFVDGKFVGSKGQAVTPTVPLCAVAMATPRTTAAATQTLDYIYIGGA